MTIGDPVFIYALTQPIDLFDGLIPLPQWIADGRPHHAAWALRAVLALTDAPPEVGWRGDMRYLPSVGGLPLPAETALFLVVKQDNNGDTFVISEEPMGWLTEHCRQHTRVTDRTIGPWEHPTRSDLLEAQTSHERDTTPAPF